MGKSHFAKTKETRFLRNRTIRYYLRLLFVIDNSKQTDILYITLKVIHGSKVSY